MISGSGENSDSHKMRLFLKTRIKICNLWGLIWTWMKNRNIKILIRIICKLKTVIITKSIIHNIKDIIIIKIINITDPHLQFKIQTHSTSKTS